MAIGSRTIEIGPAEWVQGMSTSTFIADGGFAPNIGLLDTAMNPQVEPGVMYGPPASVDGDADNVLKDEIIASVSDHQAAGTDRRLVITQESDNTGHYFRYNGTKLGSELVDDTTNTDYDKSSTDAVVYAGATFITTKAKLSKLSGASTFDGNFHALGGEFYHPLVVFENNLYIADGFELKRMTSVTDTPAVILTLPVGELITALGIDRGTGKLLIATISGAQNVSNTLTNQATLNWYDGFSNKVSKTVQVDDQIFAMYSIGNTTYMGYGQNIGFLSGSGVKFLRKLRNVGLSQDELPYKQNFANIGNTLYVIDNHVILAFGEILPGQKVWWQIWESPSNTRIDAIMPVGSNKLGISHATTTFTTIDVSDTSTIGTLQFISNKYNFPRPIVIRSIYMEYITAMADSSANRTLSIFQASEGYDAQNTLALEGETSLQNNSGGNLFELFPVFGFADKTMGFQLRYQQSATNWGLRRITIYYDFYE